MHVRSQWTSKFGCVTGRSDEAKTTNNLLTVSRNRLFKIFASLSYGGDVIIVDIIDDFHGKHKEYRRNLMQLANTMRMFKGEFLLIPNSWRKSPEEMGPKVG